MTAAILDFCAARRAVLVRELINDFASELISRIIHHHIQGAAGATKPNQSGSQSDERREMNMSMGGIKATGRIS